MDHKIKNGTVFKEENNDIHINPFWESGNSAYFLIVLKGLDPCSIMPCNKPLIKKHSARQPTEMWEREKKPTQHRENSPAAPIASMTRSSKCCTYILGNCMTFFLKK